MPDRRAIVIGAVTIIAVAAGIAGRQPSVRNHIVPANASQLASIESADAFADSDSTPATTKASAASSTSTLTRPSTTAVPTQPADLRNESVSATSASASSNGQEGARVTIAGCVEQDDETFRLKDTSGTDAPKTRSWKSGFLRKRTSSVELIDERHTFRLASHVGQRVETTGVLVDREMRVQSVRVKGSCD